MAKTYPEDADAPPYSLMFGYPPKTKDAEMTSVADLLDGTNWLLEPGVDFSSPATVTVGDVSYKEGEDLDPYESPTARYKLVEGRGTPFSPDEQGWGTFVVAMNNLKHITRLDVEMYQMSMISDDSRAYSGEMEFRLRNKGEIPEGVI